MRVAVPSYVCRALYLAKTKNPGNNPLPKNFNQTRTAQRNTSQNPFAMGLGGAFYASLLPVFQATVYSTRETNDAPAPATGSITLLDHSFLALGANIALRRTVSRYSDSLGGTRIFFRAVGVASSTLFCVGLGWKPNTNTSSSTSFVSCSISSTCWYEINMVCGQRTRTSFGFDSIIIISQCECKGYHYFYRTCR